MKEHNKTQSNVIRIIAGKHRSRKLPVLTADGLRPTLDRIKETVFNWLQYAVVNSTCLDLFAGTGNLGIEALSRGASYVDFIENNVKLAKQIQQNLSLLALTNSKVSIINAFDYLNQTEGLLITNPYDIIFIDPPFALDYHQQLVNFFSQEINMTLKQSLPSKIIHKNTLFILEKPKQVSINYDSSLFQIVKSKHSPHCEVQLIKII